MPPELCDIAELKQWQNHQIKWELHFGMYFRRVLFWEVGIGTERERSPNKKRHTKDTGTSPDGKFLLIPFAMAPASIGVDTSDLVI